MEQLQQKLDQIRRAIPQLRNKTARHDLLKMVRNVDLAMNEISRESVECRRLRRETLHYQELVKNAQNLIINLEQHLTFAALLNG
jgi:hypothetical protein